MNQELKIDDMNEEAYRQAYIQGFEAGMKARLRTETGKCKAQSLD